MAGRRPLSHDEERRLLRVVRGLKPRDRVLISVQWFCGYRISEVLSLPVGSVWRNDQLVTKIGVTPLHLKGHYGRTRWVPVLPELASDLHSYLVHLRRKYMLTPDLPLFLSRKSNPDGAARAITRKAARDLIRGAFVKAGIEDDGRLGMHSLRKTFARAVYRHSGNDLMVLKSALGHSDVSTTQKYLEVEEDVVAAAIAKVDFTRKPRNTVPVVAPIAVPAAPALTAAA
jgi:integrase